MTDNLLSISAACLFDDQGNLLLVRKRGTQAFMLPGGKREPGETPLAALQRELLEELRLPMGASTFEHLGSFQAPAANEANTRVDADIYVARLPHAVCAQAELENWPGWSPAKRSRTISRRCCAIMSCRPRGARRKTRKPRPNTGRAPIMCAER